MAAKSGDWRKGKTANFDSARFPGAHLIDRSSARLAPGGAQRGTPRDPAGNKSRTSTVCRASPPRPRHTSFFPAHEDQLPLAPRAAQKAQRHIGWLRAGIAQHRLGPFATTPVCRPARSTRTPEMAAVSGAPPTTRKNAPPQTAQTRYPALTTLANPGLVASPAGD